LKGLLGIPTANKYLWSVEQIVRYPEYTFELSAYNNRSIPALKMYGYNIKFITEAKTIIVDFKNYIDHFTDLDK